MNNETIPMAGSWVCYLLCCANDTLYCGITNDLDKRPEVHRAGVFF